MSYNKSDLMKSSRMEWGKKGLACTVYGK